MTQKRLPAIQPALKSDRITVEQAMQGWLRIRARREADPLGGGADLPLRAADAEPRTRRREADR